MISKKRMVFVFKITAREFVSGQFFWLVLAAQVLATLFLAVVADVALDETARMYDTLGYFLTSLTGITAGVFVGSHTWARDFSKSGIGELICHFDTKPFDLYLARFVSWAGVLAFFSLIAFTTFGVFLYGFASERFDFKVILIMTLFSTIHSILALSLAQTFGTFLRPALAFIGSFLLLAVGNVSDTLSGVTQLSATEQTRLPLISRWAVDILQIWRPEALVLGQARGVWQLPSAVEAAKSIGWATSMIIAFCCIAFFVTQNRQITERS